MSDDQDAIPFTPGGQPLDDLGLRRSTFASPGEESVFTDYTGAGIVASPGLVDGLASVPSHTAPVSDGVASICVQGPDGRRTERIRVDAQKSTPKAIESCVRALFAIAKTEPVVLRDSQRRAVPFDAAVLLQTPLEVYALQPAELSFEMVSETSRRRTVTRKMRRVTSMESIEEEWQFWCKLITGFSKRSTSFIGHRHLTQTRSRERWRITEFDTSPVRIDHLYESWSHSNDGELTLAELQRELEQLYDIKIATNQLWAACQRVVSYLHSRDITTVKPESDLAWETSVIEKNVFMTLWQRLMLAAVCHRAFLVDGETRRTSELLLVGFNEHDLAEDQMSEQVFFFGGNLKFKVDAQRMCCWARLDDGSPDKLIRFGVKFFLHPAVTEEAISAAQDSMTKVDKYRQQYIVSLEVYAVQPYPEQWEELTRDHSRTSNDPLNCTQKSLNSLNSLTAKCPASPTSTSDSQPCGDSSWHSSSDDGSLQSDSSERIVRSSMFLVATGNPRQRYRDWLITVINQDHHRDPLERFTTSDFAAVKVLDSVYDDLKGRGRLREFQADFLLHTIVERAASELVPICNKFAKRMTYLADRLHGEKLSMPTSLVNEVTEIRMQVQELRQYVTQLKGIVRHLEVDCNSEDTLTSWNFGAMASNHHAHTAPDAAPAMRQQPVDSGRELLLFLRGCQESLDRTADRFMTLDEMARNFGTDHERFRETFMNKTLFAISVMTAIAMPAQVLSGIYGANFVKPDGKPQDPLLTHKHGIRIFWIIMISLMSMLSMIIASCVYGPAQLFGMLRNCVYSCCARCRRSVTCRFRCCGQRRRTEPSINDV